jgi:hypothetical protein
MVAPAGATETKAAATQATSRTEWRMFPPLVMYFEGNIHAAQGGFVAKAVNISLV